MLKTVNCENCSRILCSSSVDARTTRQDPRESWMRDSREWLLTSTLVEKLRNFTVPAGAKFVRLAFLRNRNRDGGGTRRKKKRRAGSPGKLTGPVFGMRVNYDLICARDPQIVVISPEKTRLLTRGNNISKFIFCFPIRFRYRCRRNFRLYSPVKRFLNIFLRVFLRRTVNAPRYQSICIEFVLYDGARWCVCSTFKRLLNDRTFDP